jgi:hypothetical protein
LVTLNRGDDLTRWREVQDWHVTQSQGSAFLNEHLPHRIDKSATARESGRSHFDAAPRFGTADAEAILNRLQRNGGALASCECGSRNWLPPDGIYQLVAPTALQRVPAKAVVPLTCAACGFTKFYDPVVVASLAESTGRW